MTNTETAQTIHDHLTAVDAERLAVRETEGEAAAEAHPAQTAKLAFERVHGYAVARGRTGAGSLRWIAVPAVRTSFTDDITGEFRVSLIRDDRHPIGPPRRTYHRAYFDGAAALVGPFLTKIEEA